MCMVFNQSIWHIWGSLLLSPEKIDHFLSDFIFKSHSLPWSKISNPLRFWISIDLNTLKNILGREMWSGLNVSDILNNFRAPPQFMMGGWLCVEKNEFWMILRYTRNSWKIHLGTHNHTWIIFLSETFWWSMTTFYEILLPLNQWPLLKTNCVLTPIEATSWVFGHDWENDILKGFSIDFLKILMVPPSFAQILSWKIIKEKVFGD